MLARTTTTRAQTRTATGGIASRLTSRACRTSAHTRRCARVMASSAAAAPASNAYLLLTLHYVDGMLEKRGPHREAHLAGAQRGYDDGTIVMAGALLDPVDAGVFVFKNVDEAHVKAFVEADAYYVAGLVPRYTIRPWMVVVGN